MLRNVNIKLTGPVQRVVMMDVVMASMVLWRGDGGCSDDGAKMVTDPLWGGEGHSLGSDICNVDDFHQTMLMDYTLEDSRKEVKGRTVTKSENTKLSCEWKLYNDGAVSSDGSGAGLMQIDPEGKEYTYALRFGFEATNNKAEYEALLFGLRITQDMENVSLVIFVDS
uniref:Reverse transcriptase domain-containing protein n=1 Tax=Tanacetum cinerariifolium TaxID=118510 RepID=A0A6L2NC45_TANCI|nr:reverse transcriptase domain-containing protein [Tanacetum cinerariifolium]